MLTGLCLAGLWIAPVNALLFTATRPVSLVFVAGMLLALWRAKGGAAPLWLRAAMLAGAIAAWRWAPVPADPTAMGFAYLLWSGLPAVLIALAAVSGPLRVPAAGFVNRAGDASYALYLLHVPLAWFWLWLWGRLPFFDAGPWDYLASALAVVLAASWLFHRWIEHPMTLALNRWLAAPHSSQEPRRKTP